MFSKFLTNPHSRVIVRLKNLYGFLSDYGINSVARKFFVVSHGYILLQSAQEQASSCCMCKSTQLLNPSAEVACVRHTVKGEMPLKG